MMTLSILNNICDCWWLYWLLPFLLGLLLGWLLWYRYRKYLSLYEQTKKDLDAAHKRIGELEADLKKCKSSRADIESQIALLKGQLKEAQGKVTRMDTPAAKATFVAPQDPPTSMASGFVATVPEVQPEASSDDVTMGIASNKFAALKEDNLQVVEGIGPKMNEILVTHGVTTWAQLGAKTPAELRAILDTYGDKYRIIDPKTWSAQARLADAGSWMELIDLQKQLDTGRVGTANLTDSKVEKIMIKLKILKRWSQDDLKAVEGIGPKIEELLHKDGIKTWKALSEATVDRLQRILTDAGKRFQLADPGTWPQQARLAHEGKWDELEELQDVLNGGR